VSKFKPLVTLLVLGFIGVCLFLMINSSPPPPPKEVADAMLEVPEIEEGMSPIDIEEAPSDYAPSNGIGGGEAPAYVPPADTTGEAPSWSPPPSEQQTADTTNGLPPLPDGAEAQMSMPQTPRSADETLSQTAADSLTSSPPQPPTATTLPQDSVDPTSRLNAHSQRHTSEAVSPLQMQNPYLTSGEGGTVSPETTSADTVPSADAAGNVVSSGGAADPFSNDAASAFGGGVNGDLSLNSQPAQPTTPFTVVRSAAEESLRRGELSQALLMLSDYYGDPRLTPEEDQQLNTLLSQLAGTVIYSTKHELEPAYRVQAGETLADIASRYNVTAALLAKINGVQQQAPLQPNRELKVVRGPFRAIVDYKSGEIRLLLDGRYAGKFAVEFTTSTPDGMWKVQQKLPSESAVAATGTAKQLILAPASAPARQQQTLAIVSSEQPNTAVAGPQVIVSPRDMNDLFDILTVGASVTTRQ